MDIAPLPKGDLMFRHITSEYCTTFSVESCPALNHWVLPEPPAESLVLLSSDHVCLAPTFPLLIEKLPEIVKLRNEPVTGFQLCEEAAPALLLTSPFFALQLQQLKPASLTRFLIGVKDTDLLQSVPSMLNVVPTYAQCGIQAPCQFPPFRELLHVHARMQPDQAAPSKPAVIPKRTSKASSTAMRRHSTPTKVCTMVLTVYERHDSIVDRLLFYETLPAIKHIVVVWNYMLKPPPSLPTDRFLVPVYFEPQTFNSMNNRFMPRRIIDTDCVINMDDDWNMPHDLIQYAVGLFLNGFADNVIGLWKLARLHGKDSRDEWVYMYNSSMPQSMVLPSGMVFHRKYLDMYTNKLPDEARETVDFLINCDDILFNFMVANVTKQAPVFVDHGKLKHVRALHLASDKGADGLWKRKQHFEDRNICLDRFTRNFGGNPLRYTTTRFLYNTHGQYPQPSEHISIDGKDLQCMPCSGPARDECVRCVGARDRAGSIYRDRE